WHTDLTRWCCRRPYGAGPDFARRAVHGPLRRGGWLSAPVAAGGLRSFRRSARVAGGYVEPFEREPRRVGVVEGYAGARPPARGSRVLNRAARAGRRRAPGRGGRACRRARRAPR